MIINLTGQREDLIRSLLRSGKFSSVDEVVNEALRLVWLRCFEESKQDIVQQTQRRGGQWHGRVKIADDFDILPDDIADAFGIKQP